MSSKTKEIIRIIVTIITSIATALGVGTIG